MSRGIWRGKYEQGKYVLHFLATVISHCFNPALACYNESRHQLFRQWFITRGYVIYSLKKNKGNRAKWKINGFNEFELFRSMDGFALHLGSFSNDHSDDNGKKKRQDKTSKTTTLHEQPSHFFIQKFLCRQYTTTTWKGLILRFVEDLKTRQRLFSSFPELRYSYLEFNHRKIDQYFTNCTRCNKHYKVWSSPNSLFSDVLLPSPSWRA